MATTISGPDRQATPDGSIADPDIYEPDNLRQFDIGTLRTYMHEHRLNAELARRSNDTAVQQASEERYGATRSVLDERVQNTPWTSWRQRRGQQQWLDNFDQYWQTPEGNDNRSGHKRLLGAAALGGLGLWGWKKRHDARIADRRALADLPSDRLRIMGDGDDDASGVPVDSTVATGSTAVSGPGRLRRSWDRVYYGPAVATTYGATRMADRRENGSGNRAARIVGATALLLVTGYLIYRIGNGLVRIGESTIFDFGDGKDLGIDVLGWPLDHGDRGQGDGSGFDLNPFNKTDALNDDPVKHITDRGGFDIVPPLFDGDGGSLPHLKGNHSLGEDISDLLHGRIGSDDSKVGTQAGGDHSGSPGPIVGAAPAPAATPPPHASPQAAWHPRNFTVEQGSGFLREIHQLGDATVGPKHFTDAMTQNVFDDARGKFGDNLIVMPGHHGPDTYLQNGDLRISGPGEAHFRTHAMERYIMDQIHQQEEAAKKAGKLKVA